VTGFHQERTFSLYSGGTVQDLHLIILFSEYSHTPYPPRNGYSVVVEKIVAQTNPVVNVSKHYPSYKTTLRLPTTYYRQSYIGIPKGEAENATTAVTIPGAVKSTADTHRLQSALSATTGR